MSTQFKRTKRRNDFEQIQRSTLQDTSLTFEARGLLCFMLSLPEDWIFHKSWLQKQAPNCGRDKLIRLLKELEEQGYMTKERRKDEQGKFEGWTWEIFDEKQPEAAKHGASTDALKTRRTGNPSYGKPTPTDTTYKQIRQNSISKADESASHDVDQFDLILAYIFNQLKAENFEFVDGDENTIKAKLQDYINWCNREGKIPGQAGGFKFVKRGVQMECSTDYRSAKLNQAKDNLNNAKADKINACTERTNRETDSIKPRDPLTDTEWMKGSSPVDAIFAE